MQPACGVACAGYAGRSAICGGEAFVLIDKRPGGLALVALPAAKAEVGSKSSDSAERTLAQHQYGLSFKKGASVREAGSGDSSGKAAKRRCTRFAERLANVAVRRCGQKLSDMAGWSCHRQDFEAERVSLRRPVEVARRYLAQESSGVGAARSGRLT